MRVFSNPVGPGSLWFDNLTTADGTPVAYDPQARAFVPMPPFCANCGNDLGDAAFCASCGTPSRSSSTVMWSSTDK